MSLSTALSVAQSALQNASRQTSIVSRNISEASNPDYTRRQAVLVSSAAGAQIATVSRATNDVLFRQNLDALSSYQGQQTLYDGMQTLSMDVNGVDNEGSAATLLGQFQEALQLYSASPSNDATAENAVESARQLVRALNDGSQAIQSFRSDTDTQIANEVDSLNGLLVDFKQANDAVTNATTLGRDANEALDQRDAILKKIAAIVPVNTITRDANDMVLTTSDGTILFETVPRSVTFEPTSIYGAATQGNSVYVDGVPLSAGTGGNTTAKGSLAGLLQLRDDVAPDMQAQLDEIARGLINAFRETDPNGVQPDAAGLFTWSGAPGLPASGTLSTGLAADISINAAMDSTVGGDPALLRDGGANGADYVSNTGNAASYTDLLHSYADRLDEPIAFDAASGIDGTMSVSTYSTQAISYFEAARQSASTAAESKSALASRTAEALSNATGVNIDEEMTLLLDLEHSYQASARLMTAVDDMLKSLIEAVN